MPELDKINIEQYKDSISLMAEKEEKLSHKSNAINNGQQNKTINLIRLNKYDGSYDKNNNNGPTSNTCPVASSQTINDSHNKNKKK